MKLYSVQHSEPRPNDVDPGRLPMIRVVRDGDRPAVSLWRERPVWRPLTGSESGQVLADAPDHQAGAAETGSKTSIIDRGVRKGAGCPGPGSSASHLPPCSICSCWSRRAGRQRAFLAFASANTQGPIRGIAPIAAYPNRLSNASSMSFRSRGNRARTDCARPIGASP